MGRAHSQNWVYVAAGHIEASEINHLLREVNENITKSGSNQHLALSFRLVSDEIVPTKFNIFSF